jgi:hypothetical protein
MYQLNQGGVFWSSPSPSPSPSPSSSSESAPKKEDGSTPHSAELPSSEALVKPSVACPLGMSVPYLLIGGGTASFAAMQAIKEVDPNANVNVLFLLT